MFEFEDELQQKIDILEHKIGYYKTILENYKEEPLGEWLLEVYDKIFLDITKDDISSELIESI